MFIGWLEASSEKDVLDGKGEAYCKVCKVHLRAHKGDLEKHATTVTRHKEKMAAFNRAKQPSLEKFGKNIAGHALSVASNRMRSLTFINI